MPTSSGTDGTTSAGTADPTGTSTGAVSPTGSGSTSTEGGSTEGTTGAASAGFEGEYEGIILGDCDQFPTGFVDIDGTLAFSVFEESAISGSADLTEPYSDDTVPMTGTINGEGTVDASLQISGSNACQLVGSPGEEGELTGSFTCPLHECDGLWSASLL